MGVYELLYGSSEEMKSPLSVVSGLAVETRNVLWLGTCFFFFVCSVNSMAFVEETVINSQATLPEASVSRHDGYLRSDFCRAILLK